ncbi:metallophosphoesterase [Algiphilus sp.]|uniref:metallophosphoesterase n=1 Tax=Algiphilus sp. TaxID=1872431 RepID=UPI003B517FDB
MKQMNLRLCAALSALLILNGCGGNGTAGQAGAQAPVADNSESRNTRKPTTETTPHDAETPLNFIILGDAGTQDAVQSGLAETMQLVCESKATESVPGCHFAIAAGDNIYFFGAFSTQDPQFNTAFEDVYDGLDIPFYLVLGNHDNGATGQTTQLGDNQVEYTYREGRPSQMWHMPARYYTHRWGNVMELFAVDSDTIDGDSDSISLDGNAYDSAFQREWLRKATELSPARWKISMSHYNYISNGNYGDGSPSFKAAMEESLCDRVQFHVQGHEHDLRWLKPVESCGRTEFIVSGAGGRTETRPASNLGFEEREGDKNGISDYRGSAGFMWATILGDTIRVEWYGENIEGLNPPEPVEVFTLTQSELGW